MKIEQLSLPGLKRITPTFFVDERGFFLETYHYARYAQEGITCQFVQDNHSFSQKGTIRGMHFQISPGQAKLVSLSEGEIFDVVVDIRPDSPTFLQWEGVYLNGKTKEQLFIPVGFAHGFCVLSETASLSYKVSAFYDPAQERRCLYNDPLIGIEWPEKTPILSLQDAEAPTFAEVLKELIG